MKNSSIIRNLKKHRELQEEFKEVSRQLRILEKRRDSLQGTLENLARVDEVFEGVALSFSLGDICPVSEDIQRYCNIYSNAHNGGKTWGLNLREFRNSSGGEWRGADWPDRDSATLAGKRWITEGTVPPMNGKE